MTDQQIITLGAAAELLLTADQLQQIGVGAGDKLEIKITNRTLTVRALNEVERAQKIAALTKDLFERRREAYQALAEGPVE